MNPAWKPAAEYMEWAKRRSGARFNLATSGIASLPLGALELRLEDLELTGPSGYGYPPLVGALARHAGVPPDRVVHASGGTSMANHLALAALVEPGDEVLIESPGYSLIEAVARYLRAGVVRFTRRAEDGFRIDLEEVERGLSTRTRLIVVTNLHNPSSVLADEPTLAALGALAREAGARVLVDEVYLDAVFEATPRSAVHLGDQFVVTSSLTKVYGLSGLRCGFVLAEPGLASEIRRLHDLFGVNAPYAADRLALVALGQLGSIRERARRLLEANRPLLTRFLDARADLEAVRSPWGTTSFPRLRHGRVAHLCSRLREEYQTTVTPGSFFGAEQHFRIGIGCDTEVLREGLARLAQALDAIARE